MAYRGRVSRKAWTNSQKAALFAAAGLGGYAVYRYIYREKDGDRTLSLQEQLEGVRAAVYRIPATISNYYAAYVSLGQSAKLISADLQRFLTSDSTELPQSLRQCGQLIEAGTATLVHGALRAAPAMQMDDVVGSLMRLLETLDTERGRSILGFVIDRACQQSMQAFVQSTIAAGGNTAELASIPLAMMDKYLAWASSPGGQAASIAMVSAFATSAMQAYMTAAEGSNFWDDLLRVMSKPEYRSFLGIECEVSTRAFVMSLFEAMGRNAAKCRIVRGCPMLPDEGMLPSSPLDVLLSIVHPPPSTILQTGGAWNFRSDGQSSDRGIPSNVVTTGGASVPASLPSPALVGSSGIVDHCLDAGVLARAMLQARVRLCRVGVKKPAVVGVDEFVCMIVVLKEGELGWRSSARQFQEIERVSNQVVKVQETRQLLTSICGSATSAGVRTTMYCMRDIIAESPQTFIVMLALLVALPVYLASRHVLQVIP